MLKTMVLVTVTCLVATAWLGGGALAADSDPAKKICDGAPDAEKLGWRVGCQAYSFNRFTFFEAVDKVASMGLKVIEAYPGQGLSPDQPDVKIGPDMSDEAKALVKAKLAEAGVKMVAFGVTGLPNDEAACRKTFDFAKEMGIEVITSEPPPEAFDLVDKLCQEYKISVAIHNHPKPSRYWNPDNVLKVCEGRSKYIGACADTGHWMRSGVNPIEALRKLEGRIVSFHFKDLNKSGGGAHDVPWGTGEGDVDGMLAEVYRQGFKGVFSAEYEHNWENSVPEIAQGVAYFDQVAAKLAK